MDDKWAGLRRHIALRIRIAPIWLLSHERNEGGRPYWTVVGLRFWTLWPPRPMRWCHIPCPGCHLLLAPRRGPYGSTPPDPCVGYIAGHGVKSMCCGHGFRDHGQLEVDGEVFFGAGALEKMRELGANPTEPTEDWPYDPAPRIFGVVAPGGGPDARG